jgi:hypothetical protein
MLINTAKVITVCGRKAAVIYHPSSSKTKHGFAPFLCQLLHVHKNLDNNNNKKGLLFKT